MSELEIIFGTFFIFFIIFFIILMIFAIAVAVLRIIAMWKIFTKAGEEGWKAIIPVYNLITLYKLIGLSPWLLFIYFTLFIPFVPAWVVTLGMSIPVAIKLAKAFKKEDAFAVGLILVPIVFEMILAFGKAEYVLNDKIKVEVIEEKEIKEIEGKIEEKKDEINVEVIEKKEEANVEENNI